MHISQEEMDSLLSAMSFEIDDSPDFEVSGGVRDTGTPVITVIGRLLGTEAAFLVDKVGTRLEMVEGHLYLDLTDCTFFSSVALGFLFSLAQQRKEKGYKLIVIEANQQIRKMVGMMGMRGILHFCDSYADADALAQL